jgi:ketosteroid isomerase-like protein
MLLLAGLRGETMVADTPQHMVEMVDDAFNRGDIEAVLNFYENAAVVVTEPGKLARGTEELRSFFENVMHSGASAEQLKTYVIEADGVALFLSRWILKAADADPHEDGRTFVATTVLRRQSD